jgi:hypothetical protein
MTTALMFRLRGRLHQAGYHTGQLQAGATADLTPEVLVEALLELQQHIDGEEGRHPASAPSSHLSRDVARRLEDFADGVRRVGYRREIAEPLLQPGRASSCNHAALELQGRQEPSFDTVLSAFRDVLDEHADREEQMHEDADRISRLRYDLAAANALIDSHLQQLSDAFGEPVTGAFEEEAWARLLERLRLPTPCPVPDCAGWVQRAHHPPNIRGTWPADLCVEHTAMRFEAFSARVADVMPEVRGPIHDALVPLPALAHLAPKVAALRSPPAPTRYVRVNRDEP